MLIDKINHITFATSNLEKSIKFYRDILQFEIVTTWLKGAYLISGDIWLCLSYDENTKKTPQKEYTHIAFNIHREDFTKLKALVKEYNIHIWKENMSEGESIYILDPDFNKLEIHSTSLLDRLNSLIKHPYENMTLNESVINNIRSDIPKAKQDSVYETYEEIYEWMDQHRTKDLSLEKKYLDIIKKYCPPGCTVLDVGCGTGEPLGKYFINTGYNYTGIDASKKSIELCRKRFPSEKWLTGDMRSLSFEHKFNIVIAWHSLFHLSKNDQRKTLILLSLLVEKDGLFLFTCGPEEGESWSDNGGHLLYHASLSPEEYKALLEKHGFEIMAHNVQDPECGGATIWVAKKIN